MAVSGGRREWQMVEGRVGGWQEDRGREGGREEGREGGREEGRVTIGCEI